MKKANLSVKVIMGLASYAMPCEMRGFQARSVVGGVYIKLLSEKLKK